MKNNTWQNIASIKKKGIFSSFQILWQFMNKKDKIYCLFIIFATLFIPIIKLWDSFIPSLILSRIVGENVKILGFINLMGVNDIAYYSIVILSIPVMWIFGMLIYRSIDIFSRYMMCKANEKIQELLLMERKNLNFNMTNGEVHYIIKNAVDNIYNIIEPAMWEYFANILSLVIMIVQFFIFHAVMGALSIAYLLMLFICVLVRTKIQNKVVDKIEVINGKIGNHFLMSLTNLPLITMYASKQKELSVLKNMNNEFYKVNKTRANIGFWYWVIICFCEYGGILAFVLYLVFTNQPNLATTIVTTITMLNFILSTVENWGYSLNNLQVSAIKLCNITKIIPENKDLIQTKNSKILAERITKIDVNDYYVKTENFEKHYNYTFSSGKIYVFRGQSGSGKTTLINAMCGLREIVSGNLTINNDFEVKNLYNYRNKIGYLFQDSILFDRSVENNISYPDDTLNETAKELIQTLNMQDVVNRTFMSSTKNMLSGGEKKRVDIIRTISKNKDIYFLDEPTNELDNKNIRKVLKEIKKLAKQDKIVIIISHDEKVQNIADVCIEN